MSQDVQQKQGVMKTKAELLLLLRNAVALNPNPWNL